MTRTAVVLTALPVEFTAVAERLAGAVWQTHAQGSRYLVGTSGVWQVAVAEIGRGNEEASYSTERALQHFSPDVALFVGVAGGVKDVSLGDVVFATEVHGYEYGKEGADVFLPRGQVGSASYDLVQAARYLRHQLTGFAVVVEPIAAGGKVLADAEAPTADVIRRHYSQVVAVEQEGLGFVKAASARSGVSIGVIRGISDLLSGKAEADRAGGQEVAARHAAEFAFALLDAVDQTTYSLEDVAGALLSALLRLHRWPSRDEIPALGRDRKEKRKAERLLEDLEEVLLEHLERAAGAYGIDDTGFFRQVVSGLAPAGQAHAAEAATLRPLLGEARSPAEGYFLSDVTAFLVGAYLGVPDLRRDALSGALEREADLPKALETALNSVPRRQRARDEAVDDQLSAAAYTTDYLRAISNRLDHLEILGIDLARSVERYALTPAFVALSAASGQWDDDHTWSGGRRNDVVNVLAAANPLVLIGEAGSGKTTLLQWIAVSAARAQLPPQLEAWKGKVPLAVRLRRYVERPLPEVEELTDEVASSLSARKPPRWCTDLLVAGRAILLIDGLDELPISRRPAVQTWLDDLLATFPDNVFIISGRPAALSHPGLKLTRFAAAQLDPMGPDQISALVRQWHVSTSGSLPKEQQESHRAKGKLVAEHILNSPALLDLARTPLLCAVLCALAYARKGFSSLPRRRLELYETALVMLAGRRDTERNLAISPLGPQERLALLEDLAQWLIRNDHSEIAKEKALSHVGQTLRLLREDAITAEEALQDLVERSILREPAPGVIDFAHRTFLEFLAARWMSNQGDFGALLYRSSDPSFAGVIALAVGMARPAEATGLLANLLSKAEKASRHQEHLYSLVMSCVDACLRVDYSVTRRLESYLESLVPPLNSDAMLKLVAGGDTSVGLIEQFLTSAADDDRTLDRCVEALGRIASPKALKVLIDLPVELRRSLAQSLIEAWSFFPPAEYAEQVLTGLHAPTTVELRDAARIPFTGKLGRDYLVQVLTESDGWISPDLAATTRVTQVTLQSVVNFRTFCRLMALPALRTLWVSTVLSINATVLPPLPRNETITALDLQFAATANGAAPLDCAQFHAAPNLTDLRIGAAGPIELTNLAALNALDKLEILELEGFKLSSAETAELSLPALRWLRITDWPLNDLSTFAGCTNLEVIDAPDSEIESLHGIGGMTGLRSIALGSSTSLTDIGELTPLTALEHVDLTNCIALDDEALDIVEKLPPETELELAGSSVDADLRNAPMQILTEHVPDAWPDSIAMLDNDIDVTQEDFFVRSVVGATAAEEEFTHGWIVGDLEAYESRPL
ncbi:NACHT domain-containing protein [Amycolatopsis vancoresmycina]|uniref:Putative signal transduction protein with Nacht domain n=1 Tax=Amycolatopsis vancoresmycina DSM 44592 TaxID=1292037 RepID=R1GE54_9PSEU|nr:NACHT domain-containing protein [Amycolatopsis vancoresmycina]EOD69582.1 putative signal transduction protein with Nacht domain [Amycolatopsis vancoresmycina DSM 44592]